MAPKFSLLFDLRQIIPDFQGKKGLESLLQELSLIRGNRVPPHQGPDPLHRIRLWDSLMQRQELDTRHQWNQPGQLQIDSVFVFPVFLNNKFLKESQRDRKVNDVFGQGLQKRWLFDDQTEDVGS